MVEGRSARRGTGTAKTAARSPARTATKAPAKAAAKSPGQAAAKAVAKPAAETPTKRVAKTPAKRVAKTAPETPAKRVAKTAPETPTNPVARTAAKTPAKTTPLQPRTSTTDWSSIRAELVADRSRLAEEREAIRAGLDDVIRDSTPGQGDDQADSGAKTFGREHEQVLLDRVAEALEASDRAIARIDDGTYGSCENCGQAIGAERLEAFPRASLCVSCKQLEERR